MTPRSLPADGRPEDDVADTPVRSVRLFVNPRAGSWRNKQVAALRAAFEAAGATVDVAASCRELIAGGDRIDHVCAVGGDGTARDVVAMLGEGSLTPTLSVYPLGTVNLLARECGYEAQPDAFVGRIMAGQARRRLHHARIGERIMLTCASVGPDSEAIDILSPRLKRLIGRGAYLLAFCAVFVRWPRRPLHLRAQGHDHECGAVYVAKGRYFAGPWSFAPAASLAEPLLHVVALPRASRLAILRFAWAIYRHREPRDVIRFTCAALTIDGGGGDTPVQGDGDIVARLPVTIEIAPDTLTFA